MVIKQAEACPEVCVCVCVYVCVLLYGLLHHHPPPPTPTNKHAHTLFKTAADIWKILLANKASHTKQYISFAFS